MIYTWYGTFPLAKLFNEMTRLILCLLFLFMIHISHHFYDFLLLHVCFLIIFCIISFYIERTFPPMIVSIETKFLLRFVTDFRWTSIFAKGFLSRYNFPQTHISCCWDFTPFIIHSSVSVRVMRCQTLCRQLKPGRISPRTRRKQSNRTSAQSISDHISPIRDIFPNEVQ